VVTTPPVELTLHATDDPIAGAGVHRPFQRREVVPEIVADLEIDVVINQPSSDVTVNLQEHRTVEHPLDGDVYGFDLYRLLAEAKRISVV